MKAIQNIFIGKNPIQLNDTNVSGTEVLIGDEVFIKFPMLIRCDLFL